MWNIYIGERYVCAVSERVLAERLQVILGGRITPLNEEGDVDAPRLEVYAELR